MDALSRRSSRARFGVVAILLTALVVALGLMGTTAAPAQAAITDSDFPKKQQVKVLLKGKAPWTRHLASGRPLGATPVACRSDLPYGGAVEYRSAWYYGGLARTSKYTGHAEIQIYRFTSTKDARAAMKRVKAFVTGCPTTTEWVCEQCDGIAKIQRHPSAKHAVGKQSYSWTERRLGMGAERARIIAARTGRTVVVTTAAHQTDPTILTYPPPVTWKQTTALAKLATKKAAP